MAEADSEREARNRKLYRYISEAIRKVDEGTSRSKSISDLFSSTLEIHRQKIREHCEKLIFADPLLYGRKAQELLWRKGYYETVSAAKRLRGQEKTYDELVSVHLNAGIGHYHHLISRMQAETGLRVAGSIDYPLISEIQNAQIDDELVAWGKISIQTCLVYLGDLCRYKTEYEGSHDCVMSERYYLQAVNVDPLNGMPYNQLGTLFTGKNYHLDSVRYYIACLSCEKPFDGADGNLTRILDKNSKYLETISKQNETIDQQEAVKNFTARFLALVECFFYDKNYSNFNELCTSVLFDLKSCLNFPSAALLSDNLTAEQQMRYAEQQELTPDYLNSKMLHRIVMIPLLSMNKFIKENSSKTLPLKAFILAMLSQYLQKMLTDLVNIGFEVQSAKEIIEERKEKMKLYKNSKNEVMANIEDTDNIEIEVEPVCELNVEEQSPNCVQTHKENVEETEIPIEEQNGSEENKILIDEKTTKSKQKKSLALKVRRRKRRQSSNDSTDEESQSEDISDTSDNESKKSFQDDSESENNDASEASYLTYTSSDDEENEEDINSCNDEKVNAKNNDKSKNGFIDQDNKKINTKDCHENFRMNEKTNKSDDESEHQFNQKMFDIFLDSENVLTAINMLLVWLQSEDEFIVSCRLSGHIFFQTLVNILNIVNRQIFPRLMKNNYNINRQYHQSLYEYHKVILGLKYRYKSIPLPEDYDMNFMDLSKVGLKHIKWNVHKYTNLSNREANAVRLLRLIDFGIYIVKLDFGIIFNRRLKMYTFKRNKIVTKRNPVAIKKNIREPKGPHPKVLKALAQNTGTIDSHSEGLMRNLGKLWLSAQVRQLESEVRAKKHQRGFPAYIVVDAEALSKYTYLVKRLVSSKRLIVLIPLIVLQLMDEMKKDSGGARSAIRWLEFQLRSGSRFVRTQRTLETLPIPSDKQPKKMTRDCQNFIQIIEFCHYFLSQEQNESSLTIKDEFEMKDVNGSESSDCSATKEVSENKIRTTVDNSNILIFLTGLDQWEASDSNEYDYADLANSAGVLIENIQEFCVKMKILPAKAGKNR